MFQKLQKSETIKWLEEFQDQIDEELVNLKV